MEKIPKETFSLDPGRYRLEFDLAGSPLSGPDTVTVSLGNVYNDTITKNKNDPFMTVSNEIVISRAVRGRLSFKHNGGDNQGLLLDNVRLSRLSSTAGPSTLASIEKKPSVPSGMLDLSKARETWAWDWTVMKTLMSFGGGGKPGFYEDPVKSGDANPNSGRKGVLYLHPTSQEEPARITGQIALKGNNPILKMGVSANRNVDGDWALTVKVNGKPLDREKVIQGNQGWQDLTFDLSPYSGQTVNIEIEVRANNWWYEYAFFDYIRID